MQKIIDELIKKYDPEVLIVYGSYSDGTNNEASDFDALIVADIRDRYHDDSLIEGTKMDVFVYSPQAFASITDPEEYLQLRDGRIIIDQTGLGKQAVEAVNRYIDSLPRKTQEEIMDEISWCCKMLLRAETGDEEGYYRWHWLLTDSLMIYSDLGSAFYPGPKKMLKTMKENDPKAFELYSEALRSLDYGSLSRWIGFLSKKAG